MRAPQRALPTPSAQTVTATTPPSGAKTGPPLSPWHAPGPGFARPVAGSVSQTRMLLGPKGSITPSSAVRKRPPVVGSPSCPSP